MNQVSENLNYYLVESLKNISKLYQIDPYEDEQYLNVEGNNGMQFYLLWSIILVRQIDKVKGEDCWLLQVHNKYVMSIDWQYQ